MVLVRLLYSRFSRRVTSIDTGAESAPAIMSIKLSMARSVSKCRRERRRRCRNLSISASPWMRREFIYWTDGGTVAALRYDNWKVTFLRQNSVGIKVWESPFEELRWPLVTNLRMDPFGGRWTARRRRPSLADLHGRPAPGNPASQVGARRF
jgi:hypothetical protein